MHPGALLSIALGLLDFPDHTVVHGLYAPYFLYRLGLE
jgi:hypothetical protein